MVKPLGSIRLIQGPKTMPSVRSLNSNQVIAGVNKITTNKYNRRNTVNENNKINSFADIVAGDLASGTTDLQNTLSEYLDGTMFEWVEDVPLLNRIAAIPIASYDMFIRPIAEKDFGRAGLNMLYNVGETFDIVANVVKSQIPLAGGEFLNLDTLKESWGLGPTGSIKTFEYDIDTGYKAVDFIGNFVLEVLSDPLTYVSFGASGVAKGAGRSILSSTDDVLDLTRPAIKELTKKMVPDIADDVIEDMAQAIVKTKKAQLKIGDNSAITYSMTKKYMRKESVEALEKASVTLYDKQFNQKLIKDVAETYEKQLRYTTPQAYRLYEYASKIKKGADAVDKALINTAFSPIVVPYKLTKTTLDKTNFTAKISNLLNTRYKDFIKQTASKNTNAFIRSIAPEIQAKNNTMFLHTIQRANKYLEGYDLTVEEIQQGMVDYIMNTNPTNLRKNANLNQMDVDVYVLHTVLSNKLSKKFNSMYLKTDNLEKIVETNTGKTINTDADNIIQQFSTKNLLEPIIQGPKTIRQYYHTLKEGGEDMFEKRKIKQLFKISIKTPIKKLDAKSISKTVDKQTKVVQKSTINNFWTRTLPDTANLKYSEIKKSSIRNINDAIMRIKSGKDFEHAVNYITNILRINQSVDLTRLTRIVDSDIYWEEVWRDNPIIRDSVKQEYQFWFDTYELLAKIDTKEYTKKDILKWYASLTRLSLDFDAISGAIKNSSGPNSKVFKQLNKNTENLLNELQKGTPLMALRNVSTSRLFFEKQKIIQIKKILNKEWFLKKYLRKADGKMDYNDVQLANQLEIVQKDIESLVELIEETTVLFKKLQDYSNSKITSKEIIEWYEKIINLSALRERVMSVLTTPYYQIEKNVLDNNKVKYSLKYVDETNMHKDTRRVINFVDNSVTEFNKLKTYARDELVNYIGDLDGKMYNQLSHIGMLDIILKHTKLTENKEVAAFLSQLADKTSVFRTKYIPEIINYLRKINHTDSIIYLNKLIEQVDTVTAVCVIKNAKIEGTFLSNFNLNTLKNMLLDNIVNNKNVSVEVARVDDTLYNSIRQNLKNNFKHIDAVNDLTPEMQEELLNGLMNLYEVYLSLLPDTAKLYSEYSEETISWIYKLTNDTIFSFKGTEKYKTFSTDSLAQITIGFKRFSNAINDAINEIKQINRELAAIYDLEEFKTIAAKEGISQNLYLLSEQSGSFVGKKIKNKNIDKTLNINENKMKGNNTEYAVFNNKMSTLTNKVNAEDTEKLFSTEKWVEQIRQALINTYSIKGVAFAPLDVVGYFNNATNIQLRYWYYFTLSNVSVRNKTNFIRECDRVLLEARKAFKNNTLELFQELERTTKDLPYVKEYAFNNAIEMMDTAVETDEVSEYITNAFLKNIKSKEILSIHKADYDTFISKNVMDKDEVYDICNEFNTSEEVNDLRNLHANVLSSEIYTGTKQGALKYSSQGRRRMYQLRKISAAISVATLETPIELAAWIQRNTPGYLVFVNKNLKQNIRGTQVEWSGLDNPFNFTDSELAEVGLIRFIKDDTIIIRKTDHRTYDDVVINHAAPITEHYGDGFKKIDDLLDAKKEYLNLENMDIPTSHITVEAYNRKTHDAILAANEDVFGDINEQAKYLDLDSHGNSKFFNKAYSRLNFTIMGGYDSLDEITLMYAAEPDNIIRHSQDFIKNTVAGMTSFLTRTNNTVKYLQLFFNDEFALGGEFCSRMFKDCNDTEIKDFFKNEGFTAMVLKQDRKGLPKVYEYRIYDKKSYNRAVDNGAILVTKDMATNMQLVVNKKQITNNVLEVFNRVIGTTYKTMFLFTLGFPVKNAFDALVYKNVNEIGSFKEAFKYEFTAFKLLRFYEEVEQKIAKLTNNETWGKEYIFEVLKEYPKEKQQAYFLVDMYMHSEASSSLSESFTNYLKEYNKGNTDEIRKAWEVWYSDTVLEGKGIFKPLKTMRDVNNTIEQTARLSLYMYGIEKGDAISDVVKRVTRTHFVYDMKSSMMKHLETVFWFAVFPLNNLAYYLNGGLTRNPNLIKMLMDAEQLSWENSEYSYLYENPNGFIQYHMQAGNLRVGDTIFKLSPSVFDFINLVTNPVDTASSRLNPFLRVPYRYVTGQEIDPLDLIPISTQIRNTQKFLDGNPVPSLLAFLNNYNEYKHWYKYARTHYSRSWNRYPRIPRIRKIYTGKNYVRKYYPHSYIWLKRYDPLSILEINKYRKDPMYYQMTTKAIRATKKYRI